MNGAFSLQLNFAERRTRLSVRVKLTSEIGRLDPTVKVGVWDATPCVESLRSSYTGSGDITPCRMTGVTLHGVVSPDGGEVAAGLVWARLGTRVCNHIFIAHEEFVKLLCKSQFPHKSVNLYILITN